MRAALITLLLLTAGLTSLFGQDPDAGRPRSPIYCHTCERTPDGRIKRSQAALNEFKREHSCPVTGLSTGKCEGWDVDHIKPLFRGGPDTPANMQWLTDVEHDAKTSREISEAYREAREAKNKAKQFGRSHSVESSDPAFCETPPVIRQFETLIRKRSSCSPDQP